MSQIRLFGKLRAVLLGGIFCLVAVSVSAPALAQVPPGQAQDRAALLRTPVGVRDDGLGEPGTDSGFAVESPNDPDLGEQAILKRSDRYREFGFFVTMPISYTSNVALVRSGEEGDVLFTPAVGFNYTPRLGQNLYGNIGVAQQFFKYDEFSQLDFASFDARAGLVYTVPQFNNLLLRADYDFNRLSSVDLNDHIFTDHSLSLGAEMPFRIGRAQQVSVGADFKFSLASAPEPPGRHDFSAFLGYSVNLTRALTVATVGRLVVRDYVEGSRTDVSGIFSLSANYRFNEWLSANALSTFATNQSNRDVFDYDVFNVGGAVSLNVRF